MTKKEQDAVNTFFVSLIKHPKRKLMASRKFDKRMKKGFSFVIRVSDIGKEWKKLRIAVEGKKSGRPSAKSIQ